tara:strand:- start:166 stop:531 length:366 start_codon:yes stop_codon:yes gene_type:complete
MKNSKIFEDNKMVHKNYKWNLSKEKGRKVIFNMIDTILRERKDHSIHIDELHFILNNRTKTTNIMNNNKKKTIQNFIKVVYGGLINFIDDYDEFLLKKDNEGYRVVLNRIETNEWILVENE